MGSHRLLRGRMARCSSEGSPKCSSFPAASSPASRSHATHMPQNSSTGPRPPQTGFSAFWQKLSGAPGPLNCPRRFGPESLVSITGLKLPPCRPAPTRDFSPFKHRFLLWHSSPRGGAVMNGNRLVQHTPSQRLQLMQSPFRSPVVHTPPFQVALRSNLRSVV